MEDLQVVLCQQVDAAAGRGAHALAGERKAVFVHHEVIGQVGLPEVDVKAVGGGEIEKTFDQIKDAAAGVVGVKVILVGALHDKRQAFEDGIVRGGGI